MTTLSDSQKVFESLNELFDLEGSSSGSSFNKRELIANLLIKRDQLIQGFVENLPASFKDKRNSEIDELGQEINKLDQNLILLKQENETISNKLRSFKQKNDAASSAADANNSNLEETYDLLIKKSLSIKRNRVYLGNLIEVEKARETIQIKLKSYDELAKELNARQDLATSSTSSPSSSKWKKGSLTTTASSSLDEANSKPQMTLDNLKSSLIQLYFQLSEKYKSLLAAESKCANFLSYLADLIIYLNSKLNEMIKPDLERHLKTLGYPFLMITKSEKPKEITEVDVADAKEQFKRSCDVVLKIDLPLPLLLQRGNRQNQLEKLVNVLITPFTKRFTFHFLGNRKTNNQEKPEWYLSQLLKWIKENEEFLKQHLQPILERNETYKEKFIIIEFIRKMNALIDDKLESDMKILLEDAVKFSHTIDEFIQFDIQLKEILALQGIDMKQRCLYLASLNCMCKDKRLYLNWLQIEKQLCTKKVDSMFNAFAPLSLTSASAVAGGGPNETLTNTTSTFVDDLKKKQMSASETAELRSKRMDEIWSCSYSDMDTLKPPQKVESFMLMIKALNERCGNLYYPSKKLGFCLLQVELITDFHLRLCQVVRDELKTPFSKFFFSLLNAVNYIESVLEEWKNMNVYIEIQYYKFKFQAFKRKHQKQQLMIKQQHSNDNHINENIMESSASYFVDSSDDSDYEIGELFDAQIEMQKQQPLQQQQQQQQPSNASTIVAADINLVDVNESIFDEIIPSFEKLKEDMIETICKNCMWEIKSRSRNYKKEKWISMQSNLAFYKLTLTPSATDMIISLRNMLHLLKDSLAKVVFKSILKRVATELDRFFFDDLITQTQFNDGGIAQLDYDISKYILPILNEFTTPDVKPDLYFRKTQEALSLLKLNNGAAILLKEVLVKGLKSDATDLQQNEPHESKNLSVYKAKNSLKEFNINRLSVEEAAAVLKLRTDLKI